MLSDFADREIGARFVLHALRMLRQIVIARFF